MKNIEDYIKLSLSERQAHLDLNTPCLERGGSSPNFRGLLADRVGTTIPSGKKIYLCHACHNGRCSNVSHLYWGTPGENWQDSIANGTGHNPHQRMLIKYGPEKTKEILSSARRGNQSGKGNKGKTRTQEQRNSVSRGMLASPNPNRSTGRKPVLLTQEQLDLIQSVGYKLAANHLGLKVATLKARYFRHHL
jgi:hypothetical protein